MGLISTKYFPFAKEIGARTLILDFSLMFLNQHGTKIWTFNILVLLYGDRQRENLSGECSDLASSAKPDNLNLRNVKEMM